MGSSGSGKSTLINDILYRSEILGFDKNDSDIYVLWDCYWFPIKDTEIRQIKIIK